MTSPIVDIDDHRGGRRPRWRMWLAIGGLILVIGVVVWLVWFSSVLTVRDVRVVGATGKGADQVMAQAAVPMGQPLARVDSDAIAARIAAIDWVGDAEVRRGWPTEIVLAVQERTAIAEQSDTGKGIDDAGAAFDAPGKLPKGLVVIDARDEGLTAAVGVLTSLPADLRTRVVRMRASTRDDVELTLRSGAIVRWGSVDQADVKAQVLAALLARRARMYDVTAPELPTTFDENPRPKES